MRYRDESYCQYIGVIVISSKEALSDERKVWWVNQGKSMKIEVEDEFLWAPLESKNGGSYYFWENLSEVKPGDIILHYAAKEIRYVSEVLSEMIIQERPIKLDEDKWNDSGRFVKLAVSDISPRIQLKKFYHEVFKLNIFHGPLRKNDGVKEGYLFNCIESISSE